MKSYRLSGNTRRAGEESPTLSSDTTTSTARRSFARTPIDLRLARAVFVVVALLAFAIAVPAGLIRAEPGGGNDAQPLPVITLGLPDYQPGSLSEAQTRAVYTRGELLMRELDERLFNQGVSSQDRALIMVAQRNALRSWARTLMADRRLADELNTDDPNLSFAELVARNEARGLSGVDLYDALIASATSSRAGVNVSLGIDPDDPPPLPPILPSRPCYRPGCAATEAGS